MKASLQLDTSAEDEADDKTKPIIINIDLKTSNRLNKALRKIKFSPYDHFEEFFVEVIKLVSLLPSEILAKIKNFRIDPKGLGSLHITGLPQDPKPPETPFHGGRVTNKKTFISEGTLLLMASLLGEPFSYGDEKVGEMFHNVCALIGKEFTRSNEGSLVDHQYHVEFAALNFRPRYIVLYCLKEGQSKAATTVAYIREAIKHIPKQYLDTLARPLFKIKPPQSSQAEAQDQEPVPIITGPFEQPQVRVNFNGTEGITEEASKALTILKLALDSVVLEVTLKAGEMIIVDNFKAVHGRRAFTPDFSSKNRRWLQRIYVTCDLWLGRGRRTTDGLRVF